jgi:hypothetical protein
MQDRKKNLYYLEELSDYKVADNYHDVRGWDLVDNNRKKVGKVTNFLVNKDNERVVYLDVEVDKSLIDHDYKTYKEEASDGVHGFKNRDGEDHLIVPIGMAKLDESNKNVCTDEVDFNTFASAKRINKDQDIDREYEVLILGHLKNDERIENSDNDHNYYDRKEFRY